MLEGASAYGGCVSWVELPEAVGAPGERRPALDDEAFEEAAGAVEEALASAGVAR